MAKGRSDTQYTFKVNLKGVKTIWRTLILRGDHTLHNLHETIFEAFDRYDEHLYSFYFPGEPKGRRTTGSAPKEYTSPIMLEESDLSSAERAFNAARTTLDSLHLLAGQTFEYLFDFGDQWLHDVKVIAKQSIEKTTKTKLPLISERHGKSPEQYPSEEE